jgi:aspartate/methionine/tyrosine aminotransferase
MSVSRLNQVHSIGVEMMGERADAAQDPRILRLENLDTDLPPPPCALEATVKAVALDAANSYLPFLGSASLRRLLVEQEQQWSGLTRDWQSECLICAGGLAGILNVLLATIEPGDEVLLPDPLYAGLIHRVLLASGVPRFLPLIPGSQGWRLDREFLESIPLGRIRLVLMMSPSMPSGAVLDADDWQAIASFCLQHDCLLLEDAAMRRILFDGRPLLAPAALPGMAQRVITVGSASKELRMIGWRMGWIMGPATILADVARVCIANGVTPSGLTMPGVQAALEDPGLAPCVQEWQDRRDLLLEELAGWPVIPPHGGWSLLLDVARLGISPEQASARLLESARVASTAMTHWGPQGGRYLRLVFSNEPRPRLKGLGERMARALL